MRAEILRHQSSTAYYDKNHSGCMWGFLHILDLDRHRYRRKMLTYKEHGDQKHGGGTKILAVKQNDTASEQEKLVDKSESFQIENKNGAKKSSGSSHLITLLYNKLMKKKNRKLKSSSSAAQLLRTLSIHHLECDDYVLPDEMTSDSDSLVAEQSSHRNGFSARSEQELGIQNIGLSMDENSASFANASEKSHQDFDSSKIILNRSTDIEEKIKKVIKEEHRISMDGVLDKVPFCLKLSDADAEKDEAGRGGDSPRSRFGSEGFVSANSKLAHRSIQRSRSLTESLDNYSRLFESGTVREPQKLHQRSSSVREQDDNLAHRRMLRARSLSESLDRYSHLLEFISVKEPKRLPQRSNSVKEQENRHAQGQVSRSHSLSEAFDRYHLLESIPSREPQRLHRRSNSVKELTSSLAHRRVMRSRSLSESFDSYPHLLEPVSSGEPTRQHERLKSIREDDCLQDTHTQSTTELSEPETRPVSFSNDVSSEKLALSSKELDSNLLTDDPEVDACAAEANSTGILVSTEHVETDAFVHHNAEIDACLQHPELINEHDQSERCPSDDLLSLHEDESETTEDPSDEPRKTSPISVLDSYSQEDPVGLAKHAVWQGSELQSSPICFEEQNSDVYQENVLLDDDSKIVEAEQIKANSDNEQKTMDANDVNGLNFKEAAEFNFVKNVLEKSGFCGGTEEFLAVWSSSYEPVDQLLFVEDVETVRSNFSASDLDPQLLLDLTNEILLEMYESAIASSTGLSRFNSRLVPVPAGDHLIEEVLAKVSWQLHAQQDMDHCIQQVEVRDYAKDGWMKLLWDAERVGCYLEGLIFDDLVDEIVVELL